MDAQTSPLAVLSRIVAPARVLGALGLAAVLAALAAPVHGSIMLVRETRIVVQVLQQRAASIRARMAGRGGAA